MCKNNSEKASVNDLLQFCTGFREIPSMGLMNGGGISIEYLPQGFIFPSAAVCFGVIRLPTKYTNQHEFNLKMDMGILNSISHYGLP